MDRILIVYASFGEGHKRAATSLQGFLDAPCVDLLDFAPKIIKTLYRYLYISVTEHLGFFWWLIFSIHKNIVIRELTERIQEFLFYPFFNYLRKTKPAVVITTHFFPLSFIHLVKKYFNVDIKIITIMTDTRVHPLWFDKGVDLYFVACGEAKQDLIRLGVDANKIQSGYVALREGFLKDETDESLRRRFSLDNKPCILCMSSLRGKFPLLKELLKYFKDEFNIFVIYGRNKKLKKYLQSLNLPSVKPLSFYDAIWEIFQLSSVIITKPGGLTIFEGMYKKKPFIFMRYIPGQEKQNMELLIKYGIGKLAQNEQELTEAVGYFKLHAQALRNDYPITLYDIRPALKEALAKMLS
ncbi:MAG: glycosyltransferase [Candidatus Omnitrophota bacterium]|nr:glycosyltransferase [Candidatus Omnitrophota bacterium]